MHGFQVLHAAHFGGAGRDRTKGHFVGITAHGEGHAAPGGKIRVPGQLQRLPVFRHGAEAVHQRTAARRQIQGEHRGVGCVFAVERGGKAAAADVMPVAHGGKTGAHAVQVAESTQLPALQVTGVHRQGRCREVLHREVHQNTAHLLCRRIAQQLHSGFAVQQSRLAGQAGLRRSCGYTGEQRRRKADRTGTGTFQE